MVTTHLVCAAASFATQAVAVSLFGLSEPLPYVGDAQASFFFGMACAITVLGGACVQGGECGMYFGAAAVPRLAATGAIAWAWVMYASALGCQSWAMGGISIGLGGRAPLTAAAAMALVPIAVETKLLSAECSGRAWCVFFVCDVLRG